MEGGPLKTSTVKYEVFGTDDAECTVENATADEEYRRKHDGAFGTFSDDPHAHRTLGRGKRLFLNAPHSRAAVEDLLNCEHDVDESGDWFESFEGAAGVPRWN